MMSHCVFIKMNTQCIRFEIEYCKFANKQIRAYTPLSFQFRVQEILKLPPHGFPIAQLLVNLQYHPMPTPPMHFHQPTNFSGVLESRAHAKYHFTFDKILMTLGKPGIGKIIICITAHIFIDGKFRNYRDIRKNFLHLNINTVIQQCCVLQKCENFLSRIFLTLTFASTVKPG